MNARSFEKLGFSRLLEQEEMTEKTLYKNIVELYLNRKQYISAMEETTLGSGTEKVLQLIQDYARY